MKTSVDTILFDIGNVFVTWDPRYLIEKLVADRDEQAFILSKVITLDWHTNHDRGLTFAENRQERIEAFPAYRDIIEAFDTRWCETIVGTIDASVDILRSLSDKPVRLYAITNFSAEKWPDFARSHNFVNYFEGVVVSGEEGMVKPDPGLYEIAIERFGLAPQRTLFVDDRADNVLAAERLGFQGHQFTSPDLLERALDACGLTP